MTSDYLIKPKRSSSLEGQFLTGGGTFLFDTKFFFSRSCLNLVVSVLEAGPEGFTLFHSPSALLLSLSLRSMSESLSRSRNGDPDPRGLAEGGVLGGSLSLSTSLRCFLAAEMELGDRESRDDESSESLFLGIPELGDLVNLEDVSSESLFLGLPADPSPGFSSPGEESLALDVAGDNVLGDLDLGDDTLDATGEDVLDCLETRPLATSIANSFLPMPLRNSKQVGLVWHRCFLTPFPPYFFMSRHMTHCLQSSIIQVLQLPQRRGGLVVDFLAVYLFCLSEDLEPPFVCLLEGYLIDDCMGVISTVLLISRI